MISLFRLRGAYFFYVKGPIPPTPLRQNDATGGQYRFLTHPYWLQILAHIGAENTLI